MRAINPATEELIAEYPHHTNDEIIARLHRAHEAFERWRLTPIVERARHFRLLADELRSGVSHLSRRMTDEMGKPIAQARAEVEKCAWACDYFAEQAGALLETRHIDTEATDSYVTYAPLGPVLAIMPWNFPLWQVFRFAAPAMMAGNVALLKHAPNTPGCARDIVELFDAADFPTGTFQNLFINERKTEEVIRHSGVAAVTLTGSTGAGRQVASIAGESLKKCVLELGGSDPFVVLADCDLEEVVEKALVGRFQNNGQSCIAAKRFIVEEPVYEAFVTRFKSAIEELKVGDPHDEAVDVGPMARKDLRDELHKQVKRSIRQGARCLVGGHPLEGKGFFYAPTLLVDVAPEMPAFDEETFGPVAAVVRARDVDDAIRLANTSAYGLGASLWTTRSRGQTLVSRFHAGFVAVNEIVKSDPRLPFGGIKDSGFGRELAAEGIHEFTNVKTIYVA
ncbi:NADP-dependent succinic semialdehyde dehydrogenase [Lujinxingia litoralis]|uniref:NADP-dependent succinic semialdehyde dehydrogenase n=1 Tax=Lujinxingia litoralis TaxID=2211119 RepID=A0A328C9F6_9DELT|nr:NAD-dependent succinate-semialdehyde dehydrogenase [Lujinxingia litoralis]RAL22263.1 NADP-dependent succinic semialdehyde dehydrogenase [Lujinxingia litoralis]